MKLKYILIVSFIAIGLTLPNLAQASSSYQTAFNKLYKTAGTRLGTCTVCHTTAPKTNPYGTAFRRAHTGSVSVSAALKKIQPLDSDKDRFTNIVEIRARTFPGNPKSKPKRVLALASQQSTFTLTNNYTTDEIAKLVFDQTSGTDYRYVRVYGDRLVVGHVVDSGAPAESSEQSFDLVPWASMDVELYDSGLVRVFLDDAEEEAVACTLP